MLNSVDLVSHYVFHLGLDDRNAKLPRLESNIIKHVILQTVIRMSFVIGHHYVLGHDCV